MELIRCPWCAGNELYIRYHDEEWGKPLKDDRKLFELLILEGAQAGLSWITILKRRQSYREAFDLMDPEKIARYGEADLARLMENPGIIRNKLKICSAIGNAQSYLKLLSQGISFSQWLWNWVDGKPIINYFKTMEEIPASTALSATISQELKKQGFSFVGPTIVYALMQSAGLVNDHLLDCFLRSQNNL